MQRSATLRTDEGPVIYLTYSYSEARCVEAAHKIRRVMEEWDHHRIEMRPQPDELFFGKLDESDVTDSWLVPAGSLVVGVGLGGLAAALIQETSRPDLNVVCVSSPTSHELVKLARRMSQRVALYSSQDSAIAGRVEKWPELAEAHDTLHLMHGAHLRPHVLGRLILAHSAGQNLGAEMLDLFGIRQDHEDAHTFNDGMTDRGFLAWLAAATRFNSVRQCRSANDKYDCTALASSAPGSGERRASTNISGHQNAQMRSRGAASSSGNPLQGLVRGKSGTPVIAN